jgi:hypothetical protein
MRRVAGQLPLVIGPELPRRPEHGLASSLREMTQVRARNGREHRGFAISANEPYGDLQLQQRREGLQGHRARNHIAPDHHEVHAGSTDLLEHRLQGGEVAVDIVDRRDSHNGSIHD